MESFSIRIESFTGYHTFYFNLITSASGYYIHISFIDDDKHLKELRMIETNNGWRMTNRKTLPLWLTGLEKEFSNHIQQHLLKVKN